MAEEENESSTEGYLDRYGIKGQGNIEISPGNELSYEDGGLLAQFDASYRLDFYHNGKLIKKMRYLLPLPSSFKTEIDGKLVEVKKKTVYISGYKKAKFTIKVDGEVVDELERFLKRGQSSY